ncbi:IMPACT family protein [Rhizohabitans arisaemae]|uniref:IMPACT family protein n=1 Tax=Rhizohabitans arisaemae TaxID=2720610 RepID=UPI0024B2318E|nr:YigZ family protein [Rhizohabitans arisaemae]
MAAPYFTLASRVEHEVEVKRSRFLCTVAPVASEADARAFVDGIARRYGDATHNCSAYVLGDGRTRRADDDGEPGGTAGIPMLEMLVRRGLGDVAAVVTRYFGGVKLGAGGLIRAYGGTVGATLDRAELVEMVPARVVEVTVDHDRAGRLENDLRASPYRVLSVEYGARVRVEVAVREPELAGFADWVATRTGGGATTTPGEAMYLRAPGL